MSEVLEHDRRTMMRQRVLKGGTITFAGRHSTLQCVVRELSSSGARLQVENVSDVPDTFELIVEMDGTEFQCKVTRRQDNNVGVSFLAAPNRVTPKRTQSISPAEERVSLRRKGPMKEDVANGEADTTINNVEGREEFHILVAEDDPDDRMLLEDAFRESKFNHKISFVGDGEELLNFVERCEPDSDCELPGLIVLDLNMPKMDGRTALMNLKAEPRFKRIPVVVMTTSQAEDDIQKTYNLGVTAYITKPNTYQGLLEVVESLNKFWSQHVRLPVY